ncbi:MAG: YebC/PmpR family DNA-binding transcriptional regulator [Chloroflexi bacterium]|nr:YebC/PmpR family DNA-binding transcriptional regulator [Chloroflexota bacterium]MDA1270372.1 YebC/PmpR family DNA-binding transcriptional regulator [Chloroflexota bacterium]
MSGHSKWSTIKHQKGAADAKRGVLFTKISRELAIAVKNGGSPDPSMNFHLRLVLDKAKSANMPQDSISRAIKRGSGEGSDGEVLEEITYEGYGPGGGAILLQALTTNRNRTAADVRSAFNRGGGNLGESGCVAWNFDPKGVISLEMKDEERGEELGLIAIDAGADDVRLEDEFLEIFTAVDQLQKVQKVLEGEGVPPDAAQISMVPKTTIALDEKQAEQTLRLLDVLEDLDDVQKAYTNADFPPEVMERYGAEA